MVWPHTGVHSWCTRVNTHKPPLSSLSERVSFTRLRKFTDELKQFHVSFPVFSALSGITARRTADWSCYMYKSKKGVMIKDCSLTVVVNTQFYMLGFSVCLSNRIKSKFHPLMQSFEVFNQTNELKSKKIENNMKPDSRRISLSFLRLLTQWRSLQQWFNNYRLQTQKLVQRKCFSLQAPSCDFFICPPPANRRVYQILLTGHTSRLFAPLSITWWGHWSIHKGC